MRNLLLIVLALCAACATPARWQPVAPQATIAVAHFVHPQYDWELMAGVLPEEPAKVSADSLRELDGALLSILGRPQGRPVMRQAMVKQCEEIVLASKERPRFETVEYWKSVGKCMSADFLLVPYLTRWQEREGTQWGVDQPAAITLDLYLIETATGQVRRYHFEEEQQGLAENLLKGKRFFKRGGRWLTPLEITTEALDEGTRELGL